MTKTLLWDRASAIGGTGKVTARGGIRGNVCHADQTRPPRDPECKGMVERHDGYLETSFLPGSRFSSPDEVNDQLERANSRMVRSTGAARPTCSAQTIRRCFRCRRSDCTTESVWPVTITSGSAVDHSIDPRVIGRFVDVARRVKPAGTVP